MEIDISKDLHKTKNHSYLDKKTLMQNSLSLAACLEKATVHILAITTDKATRIRLLGMGIGKGTRLEVLRNRKGDVVLGSGNNRVSLSRSVSSAILVAPLEHIA